MEEIRFYRVIDSAVNGIQATFKLAADTITGNGRLESRGLQPKTGFQKTTFFLSCGFGFVAGEWAGLAIGSWALFFAGAIGTPLLTTALVSQPRSLYLASKFDEDKETKQLTYRKLAAVEHQPGLT